MHFRQLRTHHDMPLTQNAYDDNWRKFGNFRLISWSQYCYLQSARLANARRCKWKQKSTTAPSAYRFHDAVRTVRSYCSAQCLAL